MSSPDQFILLLDVDAEVDEEGILNCVPNDRRNRHIIKLSKCGYLRKQNIAQNLPRNQLNWSMLGAAIIAMRERLNNETIKDGQPKEVYIAGSAPLSVFFAVSIELDPDTMRIVSLQQRKGVPGAWDIFDFGSTSVSNQLPLRAGGVSLEAPAEGTGRLAIFVSTQVSDPPREAIRNAVQAHGDNLLGIAYLVPPEPILLTHDNIGNFLTNVRGLLVKLTTLYPYRTGISLFMAGPSSLAIAVGIAINPHIFFSSGKTIDLNEYIAGPYDRVMSVPIAVSYQGQVPNDADSKLLRSNVLDGIKRGIKQLKKKLKRDSFFFPRGFALDHADQDGNILTNKIIDRLQALRLPTEPSSEVFDIDVLSDVLCIGDNLLHPLIGIHQDVLNRLGQLFILHEIIHEYQGINSLTYQGIGRSGITLEDVDFWADAFAIGTAVLNHISQNGPSAVETSGKILIDFIDSHLEAMQAFDCMEQGAKMLRTMSERRMRRYLIWYIQRARAAAVKKPEHIISLLNYRLFVEIAPLRGHLDDRYDKIIDGFTQDTCFIVAFGGKLKRISALPQNFDPTQMIDAIRNFNTEKIEQMSKYIVNDAKNILINWAN